MKKFFSNYIISVFIGLVVGAVLFFSKWLDLFSFVFLPAVLFALIYLILFVIQVIRNLKTPSCKQIVNTVWCPAVLGIVTVCVGAMLFTGQFYSLYMTNQMPVEYTYGYKKGLWISEAGEYEIREDWPSLGGDKVVTLNANFATPTNEAQYITASIFDFPREKLFKYSKKYIPAEYLAKNKDEVGYLVVIEHHAEQKGAYTSGATAHSHCIAVWICDDEQVLSSTIIKGNINSSTTLKNGSAVGPAPDEQVSAWVSTELEKLLGKNSN